MADGISVCHSYTVRRKRPPALNVLNIGINLQDPLQLLPEEQNRKKERAFRFYS